MKFEIKNLSCEREGKYLFRNLNFCLSAGQLLLVKGHNGSGKSTLLRMLAGLISPQKGNIQWFEKDRLKERFEFCKGMSYLGHKEGIKKALTPFENITGQLTRNGLSYSLKEIENLLTQFNVNTEMGQLCRQLSQGQLRKVALAAIVLMQKKLWILDEPFTSLDKHSEDKFKQFCQQHLNQGGMLVISSHHTTFETNSLQVIDLSTKGNV